MISFMTTLPSFSMNTCGGLARSLASLYRLIHDGRVHSKHKPPAFVHHSTALQWGFSFTHNLMQLSDFGTASFDSFFRPYRVHQDGVKSSQVTGNEIVSVNTPYLVSKFTIANFRPHELAFFFTGIKLSIHSKPVNPPPPGEVLRNFSSGYVLLGPWNP